ncbi:heme-degrading domain-containing protein [Kaistia algarum]|uniref:heme-degrading domain-containing protein n=1 Tax=Kaistia algarum TaxID=2083279 RepID=UPI000CE72B19|nr:heme-degrading domain-containing protein [Kaistia algarum]MCX5514223.1 heme-degrading domain-containing protein [Kaistia algarum]PPE77212.1 heme-degrading domain-containing protein [Kaistia algarum]
MSDDEALLQDLLDQEKRFVFDRFDNDMAIALGTKIIARARQDGLAVAVDVSRGEQRLFYAALAGTSADNEFWVAGKNAVVRRFGHSSFYVGQRARVRGVDFATSQLVDGRDFRAHGGAFPIIVRGVGVVGTATVSGLPQAEDHKLVVTVIEEFLAELGTGEARAEVWTA